MKPRFINIPNIYTDNLYLVRARNRLELLKAVNKKLNVEIDLRDEEEDRTSCGSFYAVEDRKSTMRFYLWIDNKGTKKYRFATIVHESAHATYQILRHVGIELKWPTEEAYTYLQEDIIRKVSNILIK